MSAALFEITKTNARIPDPANPGFNTLGGEQRMRGLSFDVAGMVTERLYLASGYAYLDGEVVRGAAGAAVGAPIANAPEHSATAWAELSPHDALRPRFWRSLRRRAVRAKRHQRAHGAELQHVRRDGALRVVKDGLAFKVNVTNLTDEFYFEQLHMWHIVPAAGRTVTFAVNAAY